MNGGKALLAEYLVATSIVVWRDVKSEVQAGGTGFRLPSPRDFMSTTVTFGILGLVAEMNGDLAGMLGAAFLVAILVNRGTGVPATKKAATPGQSKTSPNSPGNTYY